MLYGHLTRFAYFPGIVFPLESDDYVNCSSNILKLSKNHELSHSCPMKSCFVKSEASFRVCNIFTFVLITRKVCPAVKFSHVIVQAMLRVLCFVFSCSFGAVNIGIEKLPLEIVFVFKEERMQMLWNAKSNR